MKWAALLLLTAVAFADQWTFFYPEAVTSLNCRASLVDMQDRDGKRRDVWLAEASAERNDPTLGKWNALLGEFAGTDKGLDAANRECVKWTHEARKRIRMARAK